MTSIIRTDAISTVSGTGNISLQSGNKIISPDVGSIIAPGMLVQRQVFNFKSQVIVTSQSFVDLFTCSFTPKFNTSRIYLSCNLHYGKRTTGELQFPHKFLRNATDVTNNMTIVVGGSNFDVIRFPDTANGAGHMYTLCQAYDEPSTTSTITYKFQILKTNSSYADVYVNFNSNTGGSVITIDEIAQ